MKLRSFNVAYSLLIVSGFYTTFLAQSVFAQPIKHASSTLPARTDNPQNNRQLETPMNTDTALTGTWQGSMEVGNGMTLPLVFHFQKTSSGFTGTLDSPVQEKSGIKFDHVTLEADGTLVATVETLHASFEGRLEPSKLTGVWKQSGQSIPLSLARSEGFKAPNRPQEPHAPFPYECEEVSFKNGDVEISGTLTLPNNAKSCPAIVLLHGSGPHDRDETIFFHKPFLVLADYLTKRGIAVLRYDKRGCNKTTGDYRKATSEEFAADGLAAVEFLKTDSRIDKRKIGLVGHSEGGLLAPIAASKSTDVGFIVLMAGVARPGDEILLGQVRKYGEALNQTADQIESKSKLARETYAILKAEPDNKVAIEKMKRLQADHAQNIDASSKENDAELLTITSPWYRYFISYDPRPTLAKVHCPVLAINGDHDMQVPAEDNLDSIRQAVESNGNKNVTIIELPGLNHLFQTCTDGSPQEYPTIEETISPKALAVIGDWILEQTKVSAEHQTKQ